MSYIFPEPQESQEPQEVTQQEVPVEQPSIQEDSAPTLIENTPLSPEASLPPEAQGEANGGPLGCCLGTIIGLFLAFTLVTGLSILMTNGGTFLTILVTFLGACLGGYLGWRIGKRVYKEYEPPVIKQRPYSYAAWSTKPKAKRRRQTLK